MTYAVIADVQGVIPKWILDGSSTPSNAQATAIIDAVSEEIDTVIAARGITVPVAAPAHFLAGLVMLNVYGGAARVLRAMFPDATGPGETPAYAYWEKQYDEGIAGLKNGSAIPASVEAAGVYVDPSTYFTRNPDTEEDLGEIAEPTFRRGMTF